MKKGLRSIIGGLSLLTLVSGGGCAGFYEDPVMRSLYGTPQEIMPEWAQSGGYRDYKRNEARKEYEARRVEEERAREETIWETKDIYDVTTGEKIASLRGGVDEDYEKFARSFRNYLKLEPHKTYKMDIYWSDNRKIKGKKIKSVLIELDK